MIGNLWYSTIFTVLMNFFVIYKRETITFQYTLRENHIFADFNDLRSDNTVKKIDNGENEAGPSRPVYSDLDFDDSDRDKNWEPDRCDQKEINENVSEASISPPICQKGGSRAYCKRRCEKDLEA